MGDQFIRTKAILGSDKVNSLKNKHVAVFGLGGVGGHAVETLVRMGVGEVTIVDNDVVDESNLNRQLIALHSTIGQPKVDVMEKRLLDINPELIVHKYQHFYLRADESIDFKAFDYVIDAIDTVSGKIGIIDNAHYYHVPVISALGCGNKMDPSKLVICDIYDTFGDPLAKIMRRKLKDVGITELKVVYSKETPLGIIEPFENENKERHSPGSTPFVPSVAGIYLAYEVVKDLLKE